MTDASIPAPSLILGTAGHIDHGKSTLIRALTGTDPDRLAAWARRLPHGSATSVQCLHWPMTECPDDVSREMTRWLNAEFPKSNN